MLQYRMTEETSPQAFAATASKRIMLVEDHELVRQGIKTLYPDIEGICIDWIEASCLQDALTLYGDAGDVDAVLLDLNLADCRGLQGLRRFLLAFPAARVVVLSGTHDEFVVRQARALGALGYVSKNGATTELHEALRSLCRLDARSASQAGGKAVGSLFPRFPTSAMFDRVAELGPRHLDVLELVLSGCTNQEISNATQLSLGTIKNYVSSLFLALDVKSRAHLISLFR